MSQDTFQKYGHLAKSNLSFVVKSGRYRVQEHAEPLLIQDIISKLELCPTDTLLEIGCGVGNLLIPLSFMVSFAKGIDHPEVVSNFNKRLSDPKIELVAADFFEYKPKSHEAFTKILINSVLGAVSDESSVFDFIEKAANLLSPGGRLLVSDIANSDKKSRFVETKFGKEFLAHWLKEGGQVAQGGEEAIAANILSGDEKMFVATDKFILKVMEKYRRRGWECFSLPQAESLPFGNTREDILIVKLPE